MLKPKLNFETFIFLEMKKNKLLTKFFHKGHQVVPTITKIKKKNSK